MFVSSVRNMATLWGDAIMQHKWELISFKVVVLSDLLFRISTYTCNNQEVKWPCWIGLWTSTGKKNIRSSENVLQLHRCFSIALTPNPDFLQYLLILPPSACSVRASLQEASGTHRCWGSGCQAVVGENLFSLSHIFLNPLLIVLLGVLIKLKVPSHKF